jgi:DNA-binding MarR family transcriptional regulator
LLAQVGDYAAEQFGRALVPLGMTRPQVGLMRLIAARPGLSQQELAAALAVVPSRLVALLDDLERHGWVERRDDPDDRRMYALVLTEAGARRMEDVARIARAHNEAICAPLTGDEREQLVALLRKLADAHGLVHGIHPGMQRLEPEPAPAGAGRRRRARRSP